MKRRAAAALAAGLISTALLLAGCASGDGITNGYNSSDAGGNYVSGDGSVRTIAAADRAKPVAFSGTTASGTTVSNTDYAGKVLVVNFWYAQCPPCRSEAPTLQKLSQKYADDDVAFLGVDIRDDAPQAIAFQKQFGVSYPSVIDNRGGGSMLLAFAGQVSPNTTPTTLVVDKQGRVAARFSGEVSGSILDTVITDTLGEKS
ncbi:MAG TPA: TlpA disulfide reductase family protein [Pseudolysinimonas sp.]|nr:TlpA disulfide reductase family protein [Pseudolysinimonas sp.]